MVKLQPSKLVTWVRFPSPAVFVTAYIVEVYNSTYLGFGAVHCNEFKKSEGISNPVFFQKGTFIAAVL